MRASYPRANTRNASARLRPGRCGLRCAMRRSPFPRRALALLFLGSGVPLAAQRAPSLADKVDAVLTAAPPGTRFGLLVVDDAGRELVAINPDQRFIPASNTKMFTTAAAFDTLAGLDQPDPAGGTGV